MGAMIATDAPCVLVRCSRARRFGGPPPDSVVEKQARADQPDPSRNPQSCSGLLGYKRKRSRSNHTNTRMPGLEGGFHVAVCLVDRFRLHRRGQDRISKLWKVRQTVIPGCRRYNLAEALQFLRREL